MTTTAPESPIVIGLGCSTAASADEVIALVRACLAQAGLERRPIAAFASHVRKHGSVALDEAAKQFGVPLYFLDDDELAPGLPGTCEAVAAAFGGLLQGKRKSRFATCAIAAFAHPVRPSAAIASSTLATSLAGP